MNKLLTPTRGQRRGRGPGRRDLSGVEPYPTNLSPGGAAGRRPVPGAAAHSRRAAILPRTGTYSDRANATAMSRGSADAVRVMARANGPSPRIIPDMPDEQSLPSLSILGELVDTERAAMSAHAESLDTKAGVVLGFAGVLVGLGATAQPVFLRSAISQAGLGLTVAAAMLAAWAFLPRNFPVLELLRLRDKYLVASEEETRLRLLDTQIEMTRQAASLVKRKGYRIQLSVGCLACATALIVIGTLTTGGQADAARSTTPAGPSPGPRGTSLVIFRPADSAGVRARPGTYRLHRERPETAAAPGPAPERQ